MKRLFFLVILLHAVPLLTSFAQDNTKVGLPKDAIARLGKGGINLMRFSPDGTRLVVGTDIGVWVYEVPNGKATLLLNGQVEQVNALAFSTDGKIFASGGVSDPAIQLWDLETGNKLTTLTGRGRSIAALAFAKDNTILISLDQSREISHWDVSTGKTLADPISVDLFQAAAFSQDGDAFATGDKAGIIRVWDATTNRRWATFSDPFNEAERPGIRALTFSPDGKILASSSDDKTVRLWDTERRAKFATLSHDEAWTTAVAFSADGTTLATGNANKIIRLWDVSTGNKRAILRGHTNSINALTFVPDDAPHYGGCLASGGADGTIRFWDPDTGEELVTFTTGHTEWVKAIAFDEEDTTLSSALFNGTIEVWSLKTHQELTTFTAGLSDGVATVAFSTDAKRFAIQAMNGFVFFNPYHAGTGSHFFGNDNIQLWDLVTGKEIFGPFQDVSGPFALSPNSILAVSSLVDIQGWHVDTGLELFHLDLRSARPSPNHKLTFSPNGERLVITNTFGLREKPQVWDITTLRDITPPDVKAVNGLAFSPDGTILALKTRKGIYLSELEMTAGQDAKVIRSNLSGFSPILTFSPDGTVLVESGNTFIMLWDVETGNRVASLNGHTEDITTLVFSHDGKILASGSRDGTVLLWDWGKIIAKQTPNNKGN